MYQGTIYCVIPLHHPPHSAGTESNRGLRLPKQSCIMLIVPLFIFGSPARSRTEVIAFRGHPVLETGVLTVTLLGSASVVRSWVLPYSDSTNPIQWLLRPRFYRLFRLLWERWKCALLLRCVRQQANRGKRYHRNICDIRRPSILPILDESNRVLPLVEPPYLVLPQGRCRLWQPRETSPGMLVCHRRVELGTTRLWRRWLVLPQLLRTIPTGI